MAASKRELFDRSVSSSGDLAAESVIRLHATEAIQSGSASPLRWIDGSSTDLYGLGGGRCTARLRRRAASSAIAAASTCLIADSLALEAISDSLSAVTAK